MNDLDKEMSVEIERLSELYEADNSTSYSRSTMAARSIEIEYPGLAIIASRSPALRRTAMASLIKTNLENAITENDKPIVFANATKNLLLREILAVTSGVDFFNLDTGQLTDEEFPKLTNAVKQITIPNDELEAPSHYRIHWKNTPISDALIQKTIEECEESTTIIIENFHLVQITASISSTLSMLRNVAAAHKVKLYIGIGLSHWPDVRKIEPGILYLTDLPEGFHESVNIVDKLTMLGPCEDLIISTIFDPRYIKPWRGLFAAK